MSSIAYTTTGTYLFSLGSINPLNIRIWSSGDNGADRIEQINEIAPSGGPSAWSQALTSFTGVYGQGGLGGYNGNPPQSGTKGAIAFNWTVSGTPFTQLYTGSSGTFNTSGKSNIVCWLAGFGGMGAENAGGASSHLIKANIPSNTGILSVIIENIPHDPISDSSYIRQGLNLLASNNGVTAVDDSPGIASNISEGSDDDFGWKNITGSILGHDGISYTAFSAAVYGDGGTAGGYGEGIIIDSKGDASNLIIQIDNTQTLVYLDNQDSSDGIIALPGFAGITDNDGWLSLYDEPVLGSSVLDVPGLVGGADGADGIFGGSKGLGGTSVSIATNGGNPGAGGGGAGSLGFGGKGGSTQVILIFSSGTNGLFPQIIFGS